MYPRFYKHKHQKSIEIRCVEWREPYPLILARNVRKKSPTYCIVWWEVQHYFSTLLVILIWVFPRIMVPPNHPLKNRVFHEIIHPFRGFSPYFWFPFMCYPPGNKSARSPLPFRRSPFLSRCDSPSFRLVGYGFVPWRVYFPYVPWSKVAFYWGWETSHL